MAPLVALLSHKVPAVVENAAWALGAVLRPPLNFMSSVTSFSCF